MKTEHLISTLLRKELSDASKVKLGKLYHLLIADQEKPEFALLKEALKNDTTIQSIFNYAEMGKQPDALRQHPGYIDNDELIKALGVSKRTLAVWRKKGILTAKVFQGKCCYRIKDIESVLIKNYTGTST